MVFATAMDIQRFCEDCVRLAWDRLARGRAMNHARRHPLDPVRRRRHADLSPIRRSPTCITRSAQRFGSRLSSGRNSPAISARARRRAQRSGDPPAKPTSANAGGESSRSVIDDVADATDERFRAALAALCPAASTGGCMTTCQQRSRRCAAAAFALASPRISTPGCIDIVHGHAGRWRLAKRCLSRRRSAITKPDPTVLSADRGAARRKSLQQIALVGDDEMADVQGATAAGWQAIRSGSRRRCRHRPQCRWPLRTWLAEPASRVEPPSRLLYDPAA